VPTGEGMAEAKKVLEKLLVEQPLPTRDTVTNFDTRLIAIHDTETVTSRLMWPPSNFKR